VRTQTPPIFNHYWRERVTLNLTTLRVFINLLACLRPCGCSRLRDAISQEQRHGGDHGAHVEEEVPLL